jgi:hypothetical protein
VKITRKKIVTAVVVVIVLIIACIVLMVMTEGNIVSDGITTFDCMGVQGDHVFFTNVYLPRIFHGQLNGTLIVERSAIQISSVPSATCPPSVEFVTDNDGVRQARVIIGPEEFAARLGFCLGNPKQNFFIVKCYDGYPHIIGAGLTMDQKLK